MKNFFDLFRQKKATPQGLKKIEIKIKGMHCVSCSLSIDGALEDLGGVHSSDTSYAHSRTVVEFDPTKVSEDQIKKTIKEEGYQV